jgi:hypothetical protein
MTVSVYLLSGAIKMKNPFAEEKAGEEPKLRD